MLLEQNQIDFSSFLPEVDWDWGRLEAEWVAFKARIPEPWKLNNDGREFMVGDEAYARGLRAKHPVVLVPGIVSTVRGRLPLLLLVLASCVLNRPSFLLLLCRVWSRGQRRKTREAGFARRCGAASSTCGLENEK